MNWSMALNIGEAFAEAVAHQGKTYHKNRWFLPGLQFPRALGEWLKSQNIQDIESVRVSTSWVRTILQRRLSNMPALLVTSGFESWLELSGTAGSPMLTDRDRILGVSERVSADGQVLSTPSNEDLEFLVAKLQLLKIQNVAVAFLHANKNSANEDLVGDYLTARGFQVFKSHQLSATNQPETERWRTALECAYIGDLHQNWLNALFEGIREQTNDRTQFFILDNAGFRLAKEPHNAMATAKGPALAVNRYFRERQHTMPITYFGLEEFFDQATGALALQPLQTLQMGLFGVVTFGKKTVQYETGPMGWGRGQNSTVLDVASQALTLKGPPELVQRFSDRGAKRITEALLTLSRPLIMEERTSAEALLEILSTEMRDRFADLRNRTIAGPLAESFLPLMPNGTKLDSAADGFESCFGLLGEVAE